MSYRSLSMHQEFANQELRWFSSDTEDRFKMNLKTNYELLSEKWDTESISYKFNNFGFRSDELIPHNNSIMFLGGSEVIGTGLKIDDTWASIVSSKLGMYNYNLGQSGGANDTIYRLGSYWIPILRPKIVVAFTTPNHRIEIFNTFTENLIQVLYPKIHSDLPFFKSWLSVDLNGTLSEEKNKAGLYHVCTQSNARLYWICHDKFNKVDDARDLHHKGPASNKLFADIILSIIKSHQQFL